MCVGCVDVLSRSQIILSTSSDDQCGNDGDRDYDQSDVCVLIRYQRAQHMKEYSKPKIKKDISNLVTSSSMVSHLLLFT